MVAGESGPEREALALAGEPTGEGEGPRMPGRWGEVWGEKGDCAGLLCSPWLLDTPEVLTPGLSALSAPVGRSSMEPDKSCSKERELGLGQCETSQFYQTGDVAMVSCSVREELQVQTARSSG